MKKNLIFAISFAFLFVLVATLVYASGGSEVQPEESKKSEACHAMRANGGCGGAFAKQCAGQCDHASVGKTSHAAGGCQGSVAGQCSGQCDPNSEECKTKQANGECPGHCTGKLVPESNSNK